MQFHRKHSKDGVCHPFRLAATPIAILTAAGLAGCLADDIDVDEEGLTPGVPTYSISGQASGIAEGDLQLTLNGDETITVSNDGAFSFTTRLEQGKSYTITADGHPDYSYCDLSNAQGSMPADHVDNVMADCEVLRIGTVNDDRAIHLDWDRAGDVDIAYSTDSSCDWVNASACPDGGTLPDQSGGNLSVDESELDPNKLYSFTLMVDEQASRPAQGTLSYFELSGPVHEAIIVDDTVFAGGGFLLHGAPVQGLAEFRTDVESGLTGVLHEFHSDSSTTAVLQRVDDPNGGTFVAGIFNSINGTERNHIARLNPDGSLDQSWNANINGGGITSLIVHEDRLYIAGEFTEIDGNTDYANLAVLDLDGNLDTSFSSESPDDLVWDMAILDDTLYIAGGFSNVGSEPRTSVASMNKDDGTLSSTFQPDVDSQVITVLPTPDRVYIGGFFTTVGGSTREGMAAIDPDDGSLDNDFTANTDAGVYLAEMLDGILIFGGEFGTVNGDTRVGLAAVDPETGSVQPDWDLDIDGAVISMHVDDDHVYFGGFYSEVGGETRYSVARFGRSSQDLDTNWAPIIDYPVAWHLSNHGDTLSIGGQFRGASGTIVNHLAGFALDTGELDMDWAAQGTDAGILALAADTTQLYVGGFFEEAMDSATSEPYAHAAAFNLDGSGLTNWQPQPNGVVRALDTHPSEDSVFLAGSFSTIDGALFGRAAKVDSVDGSVWAGTLDPNINNTVHAAQHLGHTGLNYLGIAGAFTTVHGNTQGRFSTLGDADLSYNGGGIDADSTIYDFSAETGNDIVLGGTFSDINGEGNAFFQAGVDGSFIAMEANNTVRAVWMDSSRGYAMAGGSFSEFGGEVRNHFAIMDLTATDLTLSSQAPEVDDNILSIKGNIDHIAVAGEFRHYEGERHGGLVVLDATTLTPAWQGAPTAATSVTRQLKSSPDKTKANILPELKTLKQ